LKYAKYNAYLLDHKKNITMPAHNHLVTLLAKQCQVTSQQVETTIELLDSGNTVPFIARYRKHLTQSLDDNQLRLLEAKLIYFRELAARKVSILKAIEKQGKLTNALQQQIESIEDKVSLEHCYAPFKTTRTNKAALASEAGLNKLTEELWRSPKQNIKQAAKQYINIKHGFDDVDKVIEGALAIAVENLSQDIELMAILKAHLYEQAMLTSSVIKSKIDEAAKFKDYFDFNARLNRLPAHRILAMLRGKASGFLRVKLDADPFQQDKKEYSYCQTLMAKHLHIYLAKDDHTSWHRQVIDTAWRSKISVNLEKQIVVQLKEQADSEAIEQFANNLTALLMAAPAGEKVTLGLDPGFRSGCKIAVIDETGRLLETATIYPHPPQLQTSQAKQQVIKLLEKYHVQLIAIGNGTASRESEQFIADVLVNVSNCLGTKAILVSEAGASVYSASQLAADEFPELDVTLRGAVSIARRLQDPLSELVKIEAKAIGVGLYQHDVQQTLLANRLQAVVEDCVNKVGVDLNTASPLVLTHVAGLNNGLAQNIVQYREEHGRFNSRQELNNVPRLGSKAFQQAAGFLTVSGGDNLLDETILHPEQYSLAHQLIALNKQSLEEVILHAKTDALILPQLPVNDTNGDEPKLSAYQEVLEILKMARRDPREDFKTADFNQSIQKITDLEIGMCLQGVVTNVANFGAFVDLGVHQDGLVHISMLSDRFVDDPHKVVKVGQIVNVKVEGLDIERKRIALTMKQINQLNHY
jgi:uncharacterized protein